MDDICVAAAAKACTNTIPSNYFPHIGSSLTWLDPYSNLKITVMRLEFMWSLTTYLGSYRIQEMSKSFDTEDKACETARYYRDLVEKYTAHTIVKILAED